MAILYNPFYCYDLEPPPFGQRIQDSSNKLEIIQTLYFQFQSSHYYPHPH